METQIPTITVFRSVAHPGDASWQWTFARWFVTPLSTCMLPVMIGALMAVLQGYPALVFLTVGAPVAVGVAAVWTVLRLYATPADLHIRPGAAALRTVWDCLRTKDPLLWQPIFELRNSPTTITIALGDASQELKKSSWPNADALLNQLDEARRATFA